MDEKLLIIIERLWIHTKELLLGEDFEHDDDDGYGEESLCNLAN